MTISLPRRLLFVSKMLLAFSGAPVARWSQRPSLPQVQPPESYHLGPDVTLWRLPLGVVRIRQYHRALPADLAEVEDKLRFPVMMSDTQITPWLDCTAWLIAHPEGLFLVDTGESSAFGTPEYFGAAAAQMGKIYPKIIDATAPAGQDLHSMLAATGHALKDIKTCVLTHTHSDHIGHLHQLAKSTNIIVAPEELVFAKGSGRLLAKLPTDGRVLQTQRSSKADTAFGPAMALTQRGDIQIIATPGHTVGHQSVMIDLGGRRILLAGDAAFDDDQVARNITPGIIENRQQMLETYARISRARLQKPTLTLYAHDMTNKSKLTAFLAA